MSRIIVKQLPKNITEDKLRNLFGSKGTITDIQLKYTADGKFRQFCFIGYQNEDDAQQAIHFFNNTCIQTNRIRVELCANLCSTDKPQAWSKYTKGNKKEIDKEKKDKTASLEDKLKEKSQSKLDEIIGKHKDDPEFLEFMKAHEPKRTLWANDAAETKSNEKNENETGTDKEDSEEEKEKLVNKSDEQESEPANEGKLAEQPISDLEYMKSLIVSSQAGKSSDKSKQSSIDLFTIKIHNVPYKVKRQEILKFFKPLKPYSVRLPSKVHGFCYVGFKTAKDMTKAMVKNKSFIKGKQVFFSDFTEKNKITKAKQAGKEDDAVKEMTGNNSKWIAQELSINNEEDISESGKIFFRNLAYTVCEEDLQKLFEEYGPVSELSLPIDNVTRQIKGFGTVTFLMPEHAVQAFNKLDGTTFHGRLLHLIPAKGSNVIEELNENESCLNFKQKKALKLKKSAQNSVNWNTLFLGSNAVAEILAKKFSTTKQSILDTNEGGSSAAVRIALGETQIVIEMKKFLEDNGVRVNAFDTQNAKRSKTVILAKNLPPDTTIQDLTPVFSKFGPIGRIVLPPSGVTAIIEYCEASEARQAFKKLAYSKFKNVPLFLEWGPEDTFSTTLTGEPLVPKIETTETDDKPETNTASNVDTKPKELQDDNEENTNEGDDLPEPNTTLFLRNLNFKTEQETVYEHFKSVGPIHTVEIAKRKDPKNPKSFSSLGYGFIQFKTHAAADYALKNMSFTNIDGKQVELKRSDRILKTAAVGHQGQRKKIEQTKQTGTKMLVRNIPFQAKVHEVRDIFKAFGELRSVRLPKKMTPGEESHRGFGFVDFVTKSDAKKAFEALSQSTHLYGRRIVLEWASTTDMDVDDLRKRAADQINSLHQSSVLKRSKKTTFDMENNVKKLTNDDDED